MPRIEIELTSSRPDGTWTWRAAGARQPKGALEGSLLPPGAAVGDVLRAESEMDMDGTRITGVLPPKAKRAEPERLVIVGPPREEAPPPGREQPAGTGEPGGRQRTPRPSRPDRPQGRPDRARTVPSGRREGASRGRDGGDRRVPTEADRRAPADAHGRRGPSENHARRDRGGAAAGRPRHDREEAPSAPARQRPKRLQPAHHHRDAFLASLPPEQRPVAEQVLRGGIPAVRQAVDDQNARARAAGEPEIKADALLALAEAQLPQLRAAEWRDRAEAAAADVDRIALRDLRAVVAGSDAAGRDDVSRALATRLRADLERRREGEQQAWLSEIRRSLADGRVVRALRVSGRPPDPGVRFPADLADELARSAGEAMTADTAPDRWSALLDAVIASPVRRTVQPRGLPAERDEALGRSLRLAAPRVPALAALLGIPPSGSARAAHPGRSGRRPPPPPPGTSVAPPRPAPGPPSDVAAAPEPAAPEPAVAEPQAPEPAVPEPAAAEPQAPEPKAAEPAEPPPPSPPSGDHRDDAVLVEELG